MAFDGNFIWVANWVSNTVCKINILTNLIVATVPVGSYPFDVVFDGTFIWATNMNGNTVSKIDTGTNTVVGTVGAGRSPRCLAFDGAYLWVVNHVISGSVSKIPIFANYP
jgi:YVTN family beta-propeller protein